MFTGLEKLPSHFNPDLKSSLNFHMNSRFTDNPNFRLDSLHQQPQSPGIPHKIREILPAGKVKYLGITVDDKLRFQEHVHSVLTTVSQRMYIVKN